MWQRMMILWGLLGGGALAWAQTPVTTLHVTSQPAGAKVFVNGYWKGITPVVVAVSSATAQPATFRLTVVLSGYAKSDQRLVLVAGERSSVAVTLQPEVGSVPPEVPAGRSSGSLQGRIICLDPGHPSETSAGTRGKQITENRANWLVAVQLQAELQRRGAQVVMTKQAENEKVTNQRRAEIANAARADLMLRLHCDAAPTRGIAVFYPDRQGTKGGKKGPGTAVIRASRQAAQAFYTATRAALGSQLPGRGVYGDSVTAVGSRQGALTGSIFSQVPVLTVEMVVLTNAADEAFIVSEAGRTALVKAMVAGTAAAVSP